MRISIRPRALLVPALALASLAGCEHDADPVAAGDAGTDAGAPAQPVPASDGHVHGDGHAAHIGEDTHAIHGAPGYTGCTAAQRAGIEDALNYARGRVMSAEYRTCLKDAFGVEAEGRMAERLIADTNTMRGVDFNCVPGDAGANAGFDDHGDESMNIVGDIVETSSTASLAAVIVHEIAHNHGWWHNFFYGPTWPDQVQSCVYRGTPFGARRAELSGPRYLASVGGEGGTGRTLRCGTDEAMVGIAGATVNGRLARLQPLCQDVEGAQRLGAPWTWGMSMPAGGVRFEDRCDAGYVLTGLEGSAGAYVERVRAVCSHLGHLQAMSGGVSVRTEPYHGRIQDHGYSRRCPNRTAATGMQVRTGSLVDGFELECDDFPLSDRGLGFSGGGHGGWGGRTERRHCPGTMALTGIYGQWDMNSGTMAAMGGKCRPMTDQGVVLGDGWGFSVAWTERAGRTQPTENDNILRRSYCAEGEVMVGMAIAANNMVGDASALCADSESWLAGDDIVRQATGVRIRPGETVERVECAQGMVATSLDLRAGWLIDRAGILCKSPDPVGSLRRRAAFGGNGGTGYDEPCPQGRAMVGMRTETRDGGLRNLTGRCGRPTDFGTSAVSAVDQPTVRGTEVSDRVDDCPNGEVMIGMEIAHGPRLASWVRGICADEDTLRAGNDPATVTRLNWRGGGGDWTAITDERCPNGEVVRGLHGARGDLQDNVGLICGKVTLLPGSEARGSVAFNRTEIFPLTIPAGGPEELRLRLSGSRFLHATVRIRKDAAPTEDRFHAQAHGLNGITWLDVDNLTPGRWFIEVSVNAGIGGTYRMDVTSVR